MEARGLGSPGAGVRDSCELPGAGSRYWACVPWKSGKCSLLLNRLSSPSFSFLILISSVHFILHPNNTMILFLMLKAGLGTNLFVNVFWTMVLLV